MTDISCNKIVNKFVFNKNTIIRFIFFFIINHRMADIELKIKSLFNESESEVVL